MIDLTQTGAAILILGEVAMVLDAEATDLVDTCPEVGDGIDVEVIHHVPRVVVDLDALVVDFADNLGTSCPRTRLSAVLLDDDRHSEVARDRPELLEALDPESVIAPLGMSEGKHLPDAPRRRLPDA